MKCPHCLTDFHDRWHAVALGKDPDGTWALAVTSCHTCDRLIVSLITFDPGAGYYQPLSHFELKGVKILKCTTVRPKATQRPPPPAEVPKVFADDYIEACLVLPDSPKASAALSRRCLQHLLREKAGVRHTDLADEIQQVLDSHTLPSHIAEAIDAVRNTGNFGAHPIKSKTTGEIVPVEPGEAEWNLEVLESLFDFFFVQPAGLKTKRDALNAKLSAAGKPPMKTP